MRPVAIPNRTLLVHAITAALAIPSAALADTIAVDGVTCTLADAIPSANTDTATGGCAAGNGRDTIQMSTNQLVAGPLPAVTSDIDFVGVGGSPVLIAGDSAHRLFRIGDEANAPDVTFNNLWLAGGVAQGGAASSGGGGGAGMGGAIFVYAGNVSIDLSLFTENGAIGGTTSGLVNAHSGGGGGGGSFGAGGAGAASNEITGASGGGGGAFGGGGGGGGNTFTNEGGGGDGGDGSGTFPGSGGTASPSPVPPSDGGFGGGGGGGAAPGITTASQGGASGGFGGGGGGGAGSGTTFNVDTPGPGGNGGFGGGGGAGGSANAAQGAAGGFGGFGGGGGSPGTGTQYGAQGQGGFGGGNSLEGGGGGGAGFGGVLFVRSGHVVVTQTQFEGNGATHGTGPGGNGLAKGGAIFALTSLTNANGNNQGMPALPPRVSGCGVTFQFNVANDAGTSNGDNVDVYGVDRTGLTLACGDRIFADGFGPP